MLGFPARFFVEFFDRHGFLSVDDRPVWQAVRGGSREYVRALLARRAPRPAARDAGRGDPAAAERRAHAHRARRRRALRPRVLRLPHRPGAAPARGPERRRGEVLGAFPYQRTRSMLHTDERLLPRRPLARAAWNYHLLAESAGAGGRHLRHERAAVARGAGALPGDAEHRAAIDERRCCARFSYDHPVYTPRAVAAQARHREINGAARTLFLRRLLALRLPRGRRGERAGRARALRRGSRP